MDGNRVGEQRPVGVGWQVRAAVSRVEEHDQPTVVVAAELLTGSAPVLGGHLDDDHIGRWPTRGQFGRRTNHLQLVFLNDQGEHRGAWPLSSVEQGHALRHLVPHSLGVSGCWRYWADAGVVVLLRLPGGVPGLLVNDANARNRGEGSGAYALAE
jgi:hypothetical protein